jgi:kexin
MAGNNKCDNAGIGTSFACPVVSGVVALILEANPNLSWRDVQGILATRPLPHSTSDSDIAKDTLAHVNGAGLWYSNLYGFGIINAGAAVLAAELWDLFGPEKMLLGESGRINLLIAVDQESTATSIIPMSTDIGSSGSSFVVESVVVFLDW